MDLPGPRDAAAPPGAATLPTEVAPDAGGVGPVGPEGPARQDRSTWAWTGGAAGSGPEQPSSRLPSDVVADAGRRLSIAMVVVAAVVAVYKVLYLTVWVDELSPTGQVLDGGVVVASLALAYILRRSQRTQRQIFFIGTLYEILVTFCVSLAEYLVLPQLDHPSELISWTCVAIALYPVLIAAPLRQVMLGSFLAAAANSLAFALVIVGGGHPVSAGVALSLLLPPYIAAGLALVPAHAITRLGRQVSQARRLGSYRLVERLGQGGMGEVWRAEHRLLARPAAIKLIKAERLGGQAPEARIRLIERFEREAQATAALESPHTVELYDFGVSNDGAFYYVMELLRGIDLEALVTCFGPQPPERVAHILMQTCDSLADAHHGGLVHRDVKPANIFLTRRARAVDFVKVVDFGLVKIVRPQAQHLNLSTVGEVLGTPAYMAPEEGAGAGQVEPRSDLYSLGCVAYWLLTGRPPFDDTGYLKLALAHATSEPVAPSRVSGRPIPPGLEALVMACLAKEPCERPAGAEALAEAIERGGFAATWTQPRAEAWWRAHLPDLADSVRRPLSTHPPVPLDRPA